MHPSEVCLPCNIKKKKCKCTIFKFSLLYPNVMHKFKFHLYLFSWTLYLFCQPICFKMFVSYLWESSVHRVLDTRSENMMLRSVTFSWYVPKLKSEKLKSSSSSLSKMFSHKISSVNTNY